MYTGADGRGLQPLGRARLHQCWVPSRRAHRGSGGGAPAPTLPGRASLNEALGSAALADALSSNGVSVDPLGFSGK